MSQQEFIDYYELLQVSPNADDGTIQRIFRHMAKQHHPDAPGGDADRFNRLLEAYQTLSDPETRASYDVRHQQYLQQAWSASAEQAAAAGPQDDRSVRERVLSLLYRQRRANMRSPGMGDMELARHVGCPTEIVDFQLWYLREKGWITRTETGQYAITADGVDAVDETRPRVAPNHLLEARGFEAEPTADTAPAADAARPAKRS